MFQTRWLVCRVQGRRHRWKSVAIPSSVVLHLFHQSCCQNYQWVYIPTFSFLCPLAEGLTNMDTVKQTQATSWLLFLSQPSPKKDWWPLEPMWEAMSPIASRAGEWALRRDCLTVRPGSQVVWLWDTCDLSRVRVFRESQALDSHLHALLEFVLVGMAVRWPLCTCYRFLDIVECLFSVYMA